MAVFHPRTRFDSFLEGALDPGTHRRVADHLDGCPMCRDEVDQRERILRAARSSGVSAPALRPASAAEPTVLGDQPGVPGWKVVLTLGAAGVAAGAVVMAAWVAGEPEQSAASPEPPALMPVPDPEPSATVTGAGAEPRQESLAGGPISALTATSLDHAVTPTARADTRILLEELRRQGWNVPSLGPLGLAPESVGLREHADAAELVLTLDDGQATAVLQECRALDGPLEGTACQQQGSSVPERTPDTEGGESSEMTLPLGLSAQVSEHADGSWTARADTAQAAYTVTSDLPVEQADRVMSLVVLSERSRVQAAQLPDSARDRLVRGFERLMPWSEDTASAR